MFGRKKNQKSKESAKSHVRNLYVLALSDGHFSEIEDHLLISVANRLGLTEEELNEIKSNEEEVDFVLPDHYDDRVDQFQDLVMLIGADGRIDEEEMKFCKKSAKLYQLPEKDFEAFMKKFSS